MEFIKGLKDAISSYLGMTSELEKIISGIISLRGSCIKQYPEDVKVKLAYVRDKCLLAERQEGNVPLHWRRSGLGGSSGNSGNSGNNNTVKHRIINTPNHWRGKEQGQNKSQETNSHFRSGGSQNQGHIQTQHIGRYISKFKKQESPVEEKILNQVILNKLNKFSAANYNDIKLFLQQILDSDEKEFLQSFMLLVFKKAASEPTFCSLYAKLISELSVSYKTIKEELECLYNEYLTIFEEVSEVETKTYENFIQRNREKIHRLGYSQFLAELTSLGVLEQDQLEKLYSTILTQICIHAKDGQTKQQLIDEYIDCLLRMTRAFQKKSQSQPLRPKLLQIRQGLAKTCEDSMTNILSNLTTEYPGISKKASFAIMDCLDIFRDA